MAQPLYGFDKLKNLSQSRDNWLIKISIIRMWHVPHEYVSNDIMSIEMVGIDSQGTKIQITLYKPILPFLQVELGEGLVYIMKIFSVVPNVGLNKATRHSSRIIILRRTMITRVEPDMVMISGLAPLTAAAIRALRSCNEFLVDTIGVVTTASSERDYIKSETERKFITVEVIDNTGKVELVLFDDCTDRVIEFLRTQTEKRPIVVVQLATVGSLDGYLFGDVVIQTFMACTKVTFNPIIPEVSELTHIMALLGLVLDERVSRLPGPRKFISLRDDFLLNYPAKKISELRSCGMSAGDIDYSIIILHPYILATPGTNVIFFIHFRWWCWTCKCGSIARPLFGVFNCQTYQKRVVKVHPRLRIQVTDGQDNVQFFVNDDDVRSLVGRKCEEILEEVEDPYANDMPTSFTTLIGRTILFKVRLKDVLVVAESFYNVLRVCDDIGIMREFEKRDKLVIPYYKSRHVYNFAPLVSRPDPVEETSNTGTAPAVNILWTSVFVPFGEGSSRVSRAPSNSASTIAGSNDKQGIKAGGSKLLSVGKCLSWEAELETEGESSARLQCGILSHTFELGAKSKNYFTGEPPVIELRIPTKVVSKV
ncbi:Nucleic acid-binding, OB-fold [Sesbania bispinosa]|nr:Nucleic acid-binding, OB-fold [Sesbania bispinosa]